MNLHTGVTLGGVTVGLSILTWIGVRWWKRDKPNWKTLVPFIAAALYGMLLILSAGGLIGGLADVALWGSNTAGGAALEHGVGGRSPDVTRRHALALTDGGHAMVVILTVALAALWKFSKKLNKKDIGLGAAAGVSLGLADGIAGWAATVLAPAVNAGGDGIVGIL
jgi:hypothetical protein